MKGLPDMEGIPTLAEFPLHSHDKLRYADTDRQGHVNNAVFSTLLETGRVEFLHNSARPILDPNTAFVIARLEIDFLGEMLWPGQVTIGTTVDSVGRSSLKLRQAIFQEDRCVAQARSVIVLMDEKSRRSTPFSEEARACLLSPTDIAVAQGAHE
ncbi:acyl-CoA thioesterase [Mycobacteroides saopaulense]|uniref:acyl-CoA thioesterase n=1 Tax=Mycobacteroides saopaulense TaxID=1578165 RepID=UPI001ADF8BDA|nr:thioesterase family protein [Mycobacteroides saopaulense]